MDNIDKVMARKTRETIDGLHTIIHRLTKEIKNIEADGWVRTDVRQVPMWYITLQHVSIDMLLLIERENPKS